MRCRIPGRATSLLGLLAIVAAGCSASSPTRPDPARPPAHGSSGPARDAACPVTSPRPAGSVPAALRAWHTGERWYGTRDLWVAEPVLPAIPDDTPGELRIKYPSVTLDAQRRVTDHKGPPRIGFDRADGSGSSSGSGAGSASGAGSRADPRSGRDSGHGSTGGFATNSSGMRWWPTVVAFPATGCWTVTETLGATTVRFTLDVTAP